MPKARGAPAVLRIDVVRRLLRGDRTVCELARRGVELGRPGAPCGHDYAPDTVAFMGDEAQERTVLVEERALQAAMLAGDVQELDRLLHPELLAVGPDVQLIDKAGDLASHRSGAFKITELREEEVRVKVLGDMAVTFVVLGIRGTIEDADVSGRMRYTRTWTSVGGAWRVVAAHISPAGA